jgi:hypothetical protein
VRCAWHFSLVAATVIGRALAHLTQRDIENEWTGATAEGSEKGRAFGRSMLADFEPLSPGGSAWIALHDRCARI